MLSSQTEVKINCPNLACRAADFFGRRGKRK